MSHPFAHDPPFARDSMPSLSAVVCALATVVMSDPETRLLDGIGFGLWLLIGAPLIAALAPLIAALAPLPSSRASSTHPCAFALFALRTGACVCACACAPGFSPLLHGAQVATAWLRATPGARWTHAPRRPRPHPGADAGAGDDPLLGERSRHRFGLRPGHLERQRCLSALSAGHLFRCVGSIGLQALPAWLHPQR